MLERLYVRTEMTHALYNLSRVERLIILFWYHTFDIVVKAILACEILNCMSSLLPIFEPRFLLVGCDIFLLRLLCIRFY